GSPLARAYEAPGRGFHWGMAPFHPTLPRGARVATAQNATLQEILVGPARENDGTFNLFGGLRTSMATCGHKALAEFNRAEVVIAPALQTEGKPLQRDQGVGMGAAHGTAAALVNAGLGVPVLGICYGMQLLVHELGGRVEQAEVGEFGRSDLHVSEPGVLLAGLPHEQTCWMSHRDTVFEAPPEFTALASSSSSPVAAVEDAPRGIYGIQFHPEVVHTPYGQQILTRFLTEVCGCEQTWSAASIVQDQVRRIREQVGEGRVICGLSGGVDSSVAALLVHRAVGSQLTCVFVDHGLMRKDEGQQVVSAFRDTFKVPLVAVDAEQRFLAKLSGVTDPETKRKAIGGEFIRVFEEQASRIAAEDGGEGARYLVQGTLYSDVIESGGGTGAATIKSHHNVGGLPEEMRFELVEPLRALFKDEVRAVGAELGLPERLVWRQPFPGPGLAIRVVGGEA